MTPAPAPLASRGARMLLAGAAVVMTGVAMLATLLAATDAEIAWRGMPVTAVVTEVGEERRGRNHWTAEVVLAVPRPDGTALVAPAWRAMRVRGGWSTPPRPPRPGDRVEAYVVEDSPPRIVPANAVGTWWGWAATLAFAWVLAAGAWLATATARRRAQAARAP